MTLDQLSQAFSKLLGDQDALNPQAANADQSACVIGAGKSKELGTLDLRSVVEALLFVGRPDQQPITSEQIAVQLPRTTVEEVDAAIAALTVHYDMNGCPFAIIPDGAGHRMELRREFAALKDRFYGRIRAARLSPAAVEVLALVAYHEPLTADEVNRLRGIPSGHILAGLVRRQLLRLQRSETKPAKRQYFTTPRFLKLFHLRSLDELPRSDDLQKQ